MQENTFGINIAQYQDQMVVIHGGYKHEQKGHFLEISAQSGQNTRTEGRSCKRCSVSLWEINFSDQETAQKIIIGVFKYDLNTAKKIDRKKGLSAELKVWPDQQRAV